MRPVRQTHASLSPPGTSSPSLIQVYGSVLSTRTGGTSCADLAMRIGCQPTSIRSKVRLVSCSYTGSSHSLCVVAEDEFDRYRVKYDCLRGGNRTADTEPFQTYQEARARFDKLKNDPFEGLFGDIDIGLTGVKMLKAGFDLPYTLEECTLRRRDLPTPVLLRCRHSSLLSSTLQVGTKSRCLFLVGVEVGR